MAKPRKARSRNVAEQEPAPESKPPKQAKPLSWTDLRLEAWPMSVTDGRLVRGAGAGHLCPTGGCKQELVWGQTMALNLSRYLVVCRTCQLGWYIPAKHLRAVLKQEAACQLSTDTPSASSESDATS